MDDYQNIQEGSVCVHFTFIVRSFAQMNVEVVQIHYNVYITNQVSKVHCRFFFIESKYLQVKLYDTYNQLKYRKRFKVQGKVIVNYYKQNSSLETENVGLSRSIMNKT